MDFGRITHLTFDCYGTLIDWENGILTALKPVLERHRAVAAAEEVLELYARYEAHFESGPYRTYREVLRSVMRSIASELAFTPSESDLDSLATAVGRWQPFPETVEALWNLQSR